MVWMTCMSRTGANKLRKVLIGLFLTGWTGAWGTLALLGWVARKLRHTWRLPGRPWTDSLVGSVGALQLSRRAQRKLAERSLVARAELEGLSLGGDTRAMVERFDPNLQDVERALASPGFDRSLDRSVSTALTKARVDMFELVKSRSLVAADLQRMKSLRSIDAVSDATSMAETKLRDIDDRARKVLLDAQKISQRVTEVDRLIGAGSAADQQGQLQDAIAQLEDVAKAYREIDRVPGSQSVAELAGRK